MTTVAFLGLGAMGSRMARRLVDAGHDVRVWNRSPQKAEPLAAAGATVAPTPARAAHGAEAVITMVTAAPALREVVAGSDGAAAALGGSGLLIDMSTVGVEAALGLRELVPAGVGVLDAPVLGSLSEAEAGELQVFVGGPAELAERATPLLSALGTVLPVGGPGAGAAAKLVANSTLFGVLGVLGEAVALADAAGLDREATFSVLGLTPLAAQAERRRAALEDGSGPVRFALALARKDSELVVRAASAAGAELRLAEAARGWLADAEEAGWGERDYSAMLRWIAGERPRPGG